MNDWWRYLLAFIIACHGLTYLLFGFLGPAAIKEWSGSRILGRVLSVRQIHLAIPVAHVVAGVAIMAAAIAIAFVPAAPAWWVFLALVGGVGSIAAFAAFWDGRAENIVQEGGIGLGLSLTLVVVALAFPGAFG